MATETFRTYYFDGAILDLPGVIDEAKEALKGIDFDTLVGTGFSGGIVIPALALAMNKNFVLVRKENDDSHHGGGRLVGQLGQRWIFVDDFVVSGKTRARVIEKVGGACKFQAVTMVGQYMYNDGGLYRPFDPSWRIPR